MNGQKISVLYLAAGQRKEKALWSDVFSVEEPELQLMSFGEWRDKEQEGRGPRWYWCNDRYSGTNMAAEYSLFLFLRQQLRQMDTYCTACSSFYSLSPGVALLFVLFLLLILPVRAQARHCKPYAQIILQPARPSGYDCTAWTPIDGLCRAIRTIWTYLSPLNVHTDEPQSGIGWWRAFPKMETPDHNSEVEWPDPGYSHPGYR